MPRVVCDVRALADSIDTGEYRQRAAVQHDTFRYLSEKEIIAMADPIVFGLDPGNSEATGTIASSGKGSLLTIPSDIGAGSLRELTRLRGGSGQQVRLDLGEYVLEVD